MCLGAAWCQNDRLRRFLILGRTVQAWCQNDRLRRFLILGSPNDCCYAQQAPVNLVAAPVLLYATSLSTLFLVELQFRAPTTCYCLCSCRCAMAKPYSSSSANCHNCICSCIF